jgi:hypothetical protein
MLLAIAFLAALPFLAFAGKFADEAFRSRRHGRNL